MKITSALLFIIFICSGVQAQPMISGDSEEMKILGIADKETGFPRLERVENGSKTLFRLRYCNLKYTQARVTQNVAFYAVPAELESVYDFFKAQFKADAPASIQLGEDKLTTERKNDRLQVNVHHKVGKTSFFTLTEKELDSLFGRE